MDNLESQTYEIFEKDPVKYSQYQKVGHRQHLIYNFTYKTTISAAQCSSMITSILTPKTGAGMVVIVVVGFITTCAISAYHH